MHSKFVAWLSLLLAAVGIFLLVRRIILVKIRQTATPKAAPLESPPMAELTPEHRILVISNGEQFGPFTRTEVITMLHSGRVAPDAMCWEPGNVDWVPVKTLAAA